MLVGNGLKSVSISTYHGYNVHDDHSEVSVHLICDHNTEYKEKKKFLSFLGSKTLGAKGNFLFSFLRKKGCVDVENLFLLHF